MRGGRTAHPSPLSPVRLRSLALAASTLTTLPVRLRGDVSPEELRASTALYPLVGPWIGALPAALLCSPSPHFHARYWRLRRDRVTGALHLDGWADCCDAAFAPGRSPEQRLALLKDPRVGTFGAAGIVLLLLGKWTALASGPFWAPLLAAPIARWAMVWTLRSFPAARPDGLGATLAGRVPLPQATAILLGILLPLWALLHFPLGAVWAMAMGVTAALLTARFLAARFGGMTGDVCGAAGEAAELAALWAFVA